MFKKLIIDLDGVLTKDKALTPFEDANIFINFLRKKSIKFKIATNNTLYTPNQIVNILNKNGISISLEELITPLYVVPKYLREKNQKKLFVIGSDKLISFFKEINFIVENIPDVDSVVIGQDKNINLEKMKIATTAIKENNAEILALNANLITKDDDGLVFPGVGSIAHMFSYATKRQWKHFGKNSKEYNKQLLKHFEEIKDIAIISDDLFTDLKPFGEKGIKTIFITTGKYSKKDILNDFKPDIIVDSLSQLINLMEN